MNCPLCQHESSVIDSRPHGSSIRRRRECDVCRHRWNTFEVDETRFKLAESVARAMVEIQVEQA